MTNLKLLLLLFLPLSFVVAGQVADAPEVVITLKTGEQWKGEILSVRGHTLVFSAEHGKTESYPRENMDLLTNIQTDQIRLVTLPGSSYGPKGMGAGVILA